MVYANIRSRSHPRPQFFSISIIAVKSADLMTKIPLRGRIHTGISSDMMMILQKCPFHNYVHVPQDCNLLVSPLFYIKESPYGMVLLLLKLYV